MDESIDEVHKEVSVFVQNVTCWRKIQSCSL